MFLLSLLVAVLLIFGIVRLVHGDLVVGLLFILAACLVGPGGYSLFVY